MCIPSLERTNAGNVKKCWFKPWVGKIPWHRKWPPTPVLLPGESHGQRSLVGYSPCSSKESGTTELLTHTSWREKWQGLGRASLEMV